MRAVRVILIVVVVLIVIILVAPFLIPVNQFRPTIEAKASAAVGRKVDVGNLSLSLFTGSLSADNLAIADDPKFSKSPFLTAKSIKVGVELLPLIMSKDLKITGITIENPEVTLLRGPQGEWNYSSFGSSEAKAQGHAAPPQAAQQAQSSNEFSVDKLALNSGRINIGSTTSQKRTVYDKVDITASNVSPTTKVPVTLTASLPGGGTLKLDGTVGPLDSTNAALTPLNAKLTVNNLNLTNTGLLDPSLGLGGLLDLNANTESQGGQAQVNGNAKLSKALLVAGGSPSTEPVELNFNTKYDLRKNSGVLEPSTLKIGSAITHLSGTFETPAESTIVHVKVDGENLPAKDLEAFLPALGINMPQGASLQGGTLTAHLQLTGPTDKLVTTGNVGLFNAKLANFDLGSKLSAVTKLVGLNTGKDLDIEKMTTNLHVSPTGLQAQNFDAVVPSLGTLVGNGDIDAKNNLDFKMAATLKSAAAAGAAGGATQPNTAGASGGGAAGGLGGLFGQVTGNLPGGVGGALGNCKSAGGSGPTIPFQIKGTTKNPSFVPDVGGVAASMLKSQLGCLGGGAAQPKAQQQQPNPNNPIDAIGGLFKKKKP
jgi:AsmA protein